jgi:hypothetical protein
MSTAQHKDPPPHGTSVATIDLMLDPIALDEAKLEEQMIMRRKLGLLQIFREYFSSYILQIWGISFLMAAGAIAYIAITFFLVVQYGPASMANQNGRPVIDDHYPEFWGATVWSSIMSTCSKFMIGIVVMWRGYGTSALKHSKWIFLILPISWIGAFLDLALAVSPKTRKYQSYGFYLSIAPLVIWLFGIGIQLGRFTKQPRMVVYWIVYAGAFIVTSVMYVFVLPSAAKSSFYVLRLIVHPLIMGLLTTTAKVMAYKLPNMAKHNECCCNNGVGYGFVLW